MKAVLIGLIVLSAASVWADDKPPRLIESVAYYGGLAAVDIYTTNKGESQGMVEKNPFMQDHTERYVLWGAKTVLMVALDQTVDRGSRRFIRIVNAGITGAIVANYFIQEQHQTRLAAKSKRGFAVSYTVRWK